MGVSDLLRLVCRFVRFGHESSDFMLATVSDKTDLVDLVRGFSGVAACIHEKITRSVGVAMRVPCCES